MTTRLGNSNRKPRGIEMEEFPFSLIRLRKKDNRDPDFGFSFFQSSTAGVEGKVLYSRCKNPMVKDDFPESVQQAGCMALPLRSYLVTMQSSRASNGVTRGRGSETSGISVEGALFEARLRSGQGHLPTNAADGGD
jgi:hypothetical protein